MPCYVAQGAADTLVEPAITLPFARRQCATGGPVEMALLPDVGHGFAARRRRSTG
ncbi:hypothetical protein [Variovorax sp. OV329]|uniref:hypothetical protein n=1 Tax=Variovorax sp. OV329 TaxID=1882825 RepID=UPI001587C1A0|nr:hypothetical protein [Variovorax sp. OV329]